MSVREKRGWEIPESRVTPEAIFNRRNLIVGGGALAAAGLVGGFLSSRSAAPPSVAPPVSIDPSRGLYPAARNVRYAAARPITPEEIASTTNNFYEFGTSRNISNAARDLAIRPWEVRIDGLVEKEFSLGIDDLLAKVDLEERVYRHRCVEGWSMVVPWTGFPLKALVEMARPLGSARYLRMESFSNPSVASGQKQSWYPWPYVEGLAIGEAVNELAFLVTGAYGKPVARSMGAPLRVHLPWKYGFKSIKSIVRFSFVEEQPRTFWPELSPGEYGFWANVNPDVPHLRWSQANERDITTGEHIPTQLFNGYGEFVAQLYAGFEGEPLFT